MDKFLRNPNIKSMGGGLDWFGSVWISMDWIGLDRANVCSFYGNGLDRFGSKWIGLDWIQMDGYGLKLGGLDWIGSEKVIQVAPLMSMTRKLNTLIAFPSSLDLLIGFYVFTERF